MSGSVLGSKLKIMTFGESHGKGVGVVIDGFPAGVDLSENDITPYLKRRRPSGQYVSSTRYEEDKVSILSGIFENKTLGSPIALFAENKSFRSEDYDSLKAVYRPSHADYTYEAKYGLRDHRGGGRASGRETVGRVMAGAVCMKLLKHMDIDICAYTRSIGAICADMSLFDREAIYSGHCAMPDKAADERAYEYVRELASKKDSSGGVIECRINGLKAGIGDPVFNKLDARLSYALMSIGACKAVEIGSGTDAAKATGLSHNDGFVFKNGRLLKTSNNSGGILGGISDGSEITIRCHIKPTPSIEAPQATVNRNMENIELSIKGRHDPVIVPRAVVVVESMCAVTLLDLILSHLSDRADDVIAHYKA